MEGETCQSRLHNSLAAIFFSSVYEFRSLVQIVLKTGSREREQTVEQAVDSVMPYAQALGGYLVRSPWRLTTLKGDKIGESHRLGRPDKGHARPALPCDRPAGARNRAYLTRGRRGAEFGKDPSSIDGEACLSGTGGRKGGFQWRRWICNTCHSPHGRYGTITNQVLSHGLSKRRMFYPVARTPSPVVTLPPARSQGRLAHER